MPDELDFGEGRALAGAEVVVRRPGLLRDVDQVGQPEILHLPGVVVVANVVPLSIETVLGQLEVEILRDEPGINVDRRPGVITGDVKRIVIHDVVEIDANPETVRDFDQAKQFRLRPVAGADRAALIFAPEIEPVPEVVADGKSAAPFGRRREPDRVVTGFGQLRHFLGDFVPVGVEILDHRLAAGLAGEEAEDRKRKQGGGASGEKLHQR